MEEIYTNDPSEWVDRCLNCKEPRCSGTCPERRGDEYKIRVVSAARAIYSGLTIQQAAEELGLSENKIVRYMKTKLYEQEMNRLRD